MRRSFLNWIVPGLVTISGGTALALVLTGATMEADLSSRSNAALEKANIGWTSVAFDGRDAVLTGTAADQREIDAATGLISGVHGVRLVLAQVTLAESASPYPFSATIQNGEVSLSGGVPNEAVHAKILANTKPKTDDLRILAGAPDLAAFRVATQFALDLLRYLEQGEVSLADLDLSIAGQAKSSAAFDALATIGETLPPGVRLAGLKITPAPTASYHWRAEFDGHIMRLTGNAPSDEFAARLRASAPSGVTISTAFTLASGEPQGFAFNTLVILKNLALLERGKAEISGDAITLAGAAPSPGIGESVTKAITAIGGTVTLEPARVANYMFSAIKSEATIRLSGFVPDQSTLEQLKAASGMDTTALELARGAPERFASGLDYGLAALAHLSEGEFSLTGEAITLNGRAATSAGLTKLEAMLAEGAPQGLRLASVQLRAPIASPFLWTAEKRADGAFQLSGNIPSSAARKALASKLATVGTTARIADHAELADGAPDGFEASALKGLGILALLDSGTLRFDGTHWSIEGEVDSAQKGFAADAAYGATGLRTLGWTYKVTLPQLPAPVSPYVWQAEKAADGAIAFTGFLPTDAVRQDLAQRAGSSLRDGTQLGAGEPPDFARNAKAGLAALTQLDQGTLAAEDARWNLDGQAATTILRQQVRDALTAAVDPSLWQINITARDAAPAVTPYLWSATKAADDSIALAGYVPDKALHQFIAVRAGNLGRDTIALASGEPAGFAGDALAGLDALTHLLSGTAAFDGSKWTLTGTPASAAEAAAAQAALISAAGSGSDWGVQLEPPPAQAPAAPPVEPAATPAIALLFDAKRGPDGVIGLSGAIPAEAARAYIGALAGDAPTGQLTILPSLPADFVPAARAAIAVIMQLPDGEAGFDGTSWHLAGTVETAADRDLIIAGLPAAGAPWATALALMPPIELCRKRVDAIAAKNGIIFKSGSATLAETSLPLLDALAADLLLCPAVTVHVEGHTDADGAEDINLALSVARAEAVVNALLERGVAMERLYAEGYGEGVPVASNQTNAGKKSNRRIAFTLSDGQQ